MDKKKQFAVLFGRTYFKTPVPFSRDWGAVFPVALVVAAVAFILFDHSVSGVLLALTPLAAVQQLSEDFQQYKARQDDKIEQQQQLIDKQQKVVDRIRLYGRGLEPAEPDGSLRKDPKLDKALRAYFGHGDGKLYEELGGQYYAAQDMKVGSDPSGGYYVIPQLASRVRELLRELTPFRQIARTVPIESDEYREPFNTDDPAAQWVGETEARPATDAPTTRLHSVPTHEIYAMPECTQQLVDDADFPVTDWATDKVGQAFSDAEGTAFVNGSGVGRPRGLLTYTAVATDDATRPWAELQYVPTGAAGAFSGSDALIDLVYKLKTPYLANARWLMSRSTAAEVRKLKDGDGLYLWQRALVAGQPETLLGYPVTLAEDMPTIGANSFSIAFGDFMRGYLIVERRRITLLRDPYTNKPYIRLYFTQRVGGDVSDFHAIKLLKFSAT